MEVSRERVGPQNDIGSDSAKFDVSVSYSEIESLIELALRAPSGDNCQPWRFTWNDNTLAIFYEQSLGQHALANNNHATWLSLGCLIEALIIGASGLKLRLSERYDFANWKSAPVAILKFQRQTMKTEALISEIQRRKTVRLPYVETELPADVIKLLRVEASTFTTCDFSLKSEKPIEILDYLTFCDEFMWKNRKVATDFLKWVRTDQKEIESHDDGMPWWTLGIQKAELVPIRIFRRYPKLIGLLWNLGFAKKMNQMTRTLALGQQALYCVAIKQTDAFHVMEAGRLAYRLWLTLSLEGYCVQPLSIPSMTGFDVEMGFPPPSTEESAIQRFKSGYQKLRKFFAFSNEQYPVWMFRTGKVLESTQQISTPRVNVHERLRVYTRDQ
ncbi:MAG: hypothetical protein IPK04_07135 [Bdellovibrionales bacterium]|nr:hypothetical protein [Bdellovibrionales bacterium]